MLKLARQIAGLTQRQLAQRSGVDGSTISLLEQGRRSHEVVSYRDVRRLAYALHVDPDLIFPVQPFEASGTKDRGEAAASAAPGQTHA